MGRMTCSHLRTFHRTIECNKTPHTAYSCVYVYTYTHDTHMIHTCIHAQQCLLCTISVWACIFGPTGSLVSTHPLNASHNVLLTPVHVMLLLQSSLLTRYTLAMAIDLYNACACMCMCQFWRKKVPVSLSIYTASLSIPCHHSWWWKDASIDFGTVLVYPMPTICVSLYHSHMLDLLWLCMLNTHYSHYCVYVYSS